MDPRVASAATKVGVSRVPTAAVRTDRRTYHRGVERTPLDLYEPPITAWGQAWRVVGMLVFSAIAGASSLPNEWRVSHTLVAVDLAVAAAGFVLVYYRRRWPMPVATVLVAAGVVSSAVSGPGLLASVSLATRRRWWQLGVLGTLNVAVQFVFGQIVPPSDSAPWWVGTLVTVVVTAAVLAWGMYIGSRRELIWTLKSRAERAESEQELRIGRARTTERARIAREMHDVLAHRISQVSMHANALAFRTDLDADEMRASATVIQETAHQALADLRGVLGVLRDPESGERLEPPQPTYDDLAELLDSARSSGLTVRFDDELGASGESLPDVIGRTVYRIVQEGMTNAAKHAPGATLRILVRGSPTEGVSVELRNPLGFAPSTTPGAGLGLVGLTERAELRGGRLEGRREGYSFVLRGWIPWTA
jgi:signal transduction histidine kinase